MRYIMIGFIFFAMFKQEVYGQNQCDCHDLVTKAINDLQDNYSDRKNLEKNKYFNQLKKRIKKTRITGSDDSCVYILYDLVSSFKDFHIGFTIDRDSGAFSRILYDSSRMKVLYDNYMDRPLDKNKIEGVWETEGKTHEYIIVKSKQAGLFNVLIWNANNPLLKRGQLKGTLLKVNQNSFLYKSYVNAKLITAYKIERKGHYLYSPNSGFWQHSAPGIPTLQKIDLRPSLRSVSDSVLMLTMPSFSPVYKPYLDSLIENNKQKILNTKHLIIDMRINFGGTTSTYAGVLPILYTNPIRVESAWIYSSPKNIADKKASFLNRKDSLTSEWLANRELLSQMETRPNTLILDSGYYIKYDTLYKYPEKISILISDRCGSAGELFLISAMQSKKVTLFGKNTFGTIDRSDAAFFENECKVLKISVPTMLRNPEVYKKPIDNIGISPNIRIPENTDWINYVIEHKKNNE
jgi:Peptidase family S41